MSRKLLTNFNAAPYYDDFDLDKNFLKVLFKPGVALQTRELNQLQSIINDQNSKFANHIFKDGSSVFDGNITIDVNVKYIKLHDYERNIPDTTGVNVNSYLTELENRTLVSEDGTVEFLVKRVEVSNTNEPNTVVGIYLRGNNIGGNVIMSTKAQSALPSYTVTTGVYNVTQNILSGDTISGPASTASINEGIFYISGFFSKVQKQTIILDKYSNRPSYRVGLEVQENLVSSNDDNSLYDNAQGSPNFTAPGADRFNINLLLKKIELLDSDGTLIQNDSSFDFYEFLRVKDGRKIDHILNSQYSNIGRELARRTYDINGDFVIRNFILDIDTFAETSKEDKLKVTLDSGKAYVKGYEIETISPVRIEMDKGRDFNTKLEDNVNAFIGDNIKVVFSEETFPTEFINQLENSPKLDLYDQNNFSLTLNKNQDTDGNEIDFSDSDFIVGSQVSLSDTNTRKILDWNSSTGTLSLENKTGIDLVGLEQGTVSSSGQLSSNITSITTKKLYIEDQADLDAGSFLSGNEIYQGSDYQTSTIKGTVSSWDYDSKELIITTTNSFLTQDVLKKDINTVTSTLTIQKQVDGNGEDIDFDGNEFTVGAAVQQQIGNDLVSATVQSWDATNVDGSSKAVGTLVILENGSQSLFQSNISIDGYTVTEIVSDDVQTSTTNYNITSKNDLLVLDPQTVGSNDYNVNEQLYQGESYSLNYTARGLVVNWLSTSSELTVSLSSGDLEFSTDYPLLKDGNLFDIQTVQDNKIGTCRIKKVFHELNEYKISIFDLQLNTKYTTNEIYGFKYSDSYVFYVSPNVGDLVLEDTGEYSSLLFKLPKTSIKSVSKVSFFHNKILKPNFRQFDENGKPVLEIKIDKAVEQFTLNTYTSWDFFYPNRLETLKNNIIVFNNETGKVYENFDFRRNESLADVGYIKLYAESNELPDFAGNPEESSSKITVFCKVEIDNGIYKRKSFPESLPDPIIPNTQDMKTVGKIVSLNQADVQTFSVIGIDSEGVETVITSKYSFDNGQRDAFYDFSSIKLKSAMENDVSIYDSFRIEYNYLEHTSGHFFIADSYENINYENVPVYTSKNTGKSYSLTDVIDFRPTRKVVNGVDAVYDSYLPFGAADEFIEMDYEYYLPRIDKVVLTKDRQFKIIRGISSESPKTPPDDTESMTLYIVTVPPYTYDDNDVTVIPVFNRRYTMKDIGLLDRKIQELQKTSSLSSLQEKSKNVQIRDSQGRDVFKNGILIDDFSGHRVGDVVSGEYRCSVDFDTRELRPAFQSDSHGFVLDDEYSQNVIQKGPILLADYETESFKDQPIQSVLDNEGTTINVNPSSLTYYFGEMKINPASDVWYNQNLDPRVNINTKGENDAWLKSTNTVLDYFGKGFGTQWNDWEKIWTGKELFVSYSEDNSLETSTNNIIENVNREIQDALFETENLNSLFGISNRIESDVLNKKIDNGIVPIMREKSIDFVCTNLNTDLDHFVFFDDINVDGHVTPASIVGVSDGTVFVDGVYDGETITTINGSGKVLLRNGNKLFVRMYSGRFESGDVVFGKTDITVTSYQKPDSLKSDESGNLCGTFLIPSQEPNLVYDGDNGYVDNTLRFRTGQRLLRVTESSENSLSQDDLSLAESVYSSQGIIQDPENYVVSTRLPIKRRSSISDELSISRDVFGREASSIDRLFNWKDPLSQTFSVDYSEYRNGLFLESVVLYLKDLGDLKENTYPLSIEIRPTVNGFPSTSIIIPFSEVIKSSSDIVYGDEGTKFTFEVPVYLTPGEYALVIKSNSPNYELHTAIVGIDDVDGNKPSQELGSLFSSSNSSNWTALNNTMLKLKLNRCKFVQGISNFKFKLDDSVSIPEKQFNLFKFNIGILKNNFDMNFKYRVGNEPTFLDFSDNRNEDLDKVKTLSSSSDFQVTSSFTITDNSISPIVDLDRVNLITVKNLINRFDPESSDQPEVVYVSKRVNLKSAYESKDVRVYLDMFKPVNTNVYVYYKVADTNITNNFDDEPWHLMKQLTPEYIFSEYNNDYREYIFGTGGGAKPVVDGDIIKYNVYAVKVVFSSENLASVPKVRNLRAIALQEPAGV